MKLSWLSRIWPVLAALFCPLYAAGQDFFLMPARVEGKDTVMQAWLPEVHVRAHRVFRTRAQERKFEKLERDVRKVWPFALIAGEEFERLNYELVGVEDKNRQKELIKETEQRILDKYEGELKKLTISQGRILIKLIDRQTGNTSYDVVKELRGGFSAFFWQGVARIFGHNLKEPYDPYGGDRDIESIIHSIEAEAVERRKLMEEPVKPAGGIRFTQPAPPK